MPLPVGVRGLSHPQPRKLTMRHRLLSVLAVLGSLVVLAGCGDSIDKNAYVRDVSSVQQSTQNEANRLTENLSSAKTPAAVASRLQQLATAVKTNADRLAAIEAPEDVTDEHQQYVELMRTFSKDLGGLAERIKTATPETIPGIMSDTSKLTSELATDEQKIVSEINQALQS